MTTGRINQVAVGETRRTTRGTSRSLSSQRPAGTGAQVRQPTSKAEIHGNTLTVDAATPDKRTVHGNQEDRSRSRRQGGPRQWLPSLQGPGSGEGQGVREPSLDSSPTIPPTADTLARSTVSTRRPGPHRAGSASQDESGQYRSLDQTDCQGFLGIASSGASTRRTACRTLGSITAGQPLSCLSTSDRDLSPT